MPLDAHFAHELNSRPSNGRVPIYKRDDVFHADTQLDLRTCFRVQFKSENASEQVRRHLQSSPKFNAYEAFNSMDLNSDGIVH